MAETIEMSLGLKTRVGPRKRALDESPNPLWKGAILRGDGAARCRVYWLPVLCAKTTEPSGMPLGIWIRVGPRKHVLGWDAHWRHLANTVEPSMCGGDAAHYQITLSTCFSIIASTLHTGQSLTAVLFCWGLEKSQTKMMRSKMRQLQLVPVLMKNRPWTHYSDCYFNANVAVIFHNVHSASVGNVCHSRSELTVAIFAMHVLLFVSSVTLPCDMTVYNVLRICPYVALTIIECLVSHYELRPPT